MARITQGAVYRCNFEPIVGRELSGTRRALVLSSDELHGLTPVAIVAPTSGREPPNDVTSWHRPIAESESWASVRQVKTVPISTLDSRSTEGEATREEFNDIRQRITLCFVTAALDKRTQFEGTEIPIRPGTVVTTRAYSSSGAEYFQRCLICNYNGNGIANVFVIADQPRPNSRIAVEIGSPAGPLTVLTHQIRSIDLIKRFISVDHIVGPHDLIFVVGRFLDLISWQRA